MEPAILTLQGVEVAGATDGSHVSLSVAAWLRLGGQVALAAPAPPRGPGSRPGGASTPCPSLPFPLPLPLSGEWLFLPGVAPPCSPLPAPGAPSRELSFALFALGCGGVRGDPGGARASSSSTGAPPAGAPCGAWPPTRASPSPSTRPSAHAP